jgi:type IV pilus assembly protein PilW
MSYPLHIPSTRLAVQARQKGRTLIEVLVALVIGLIVLTAVLISTSGSNFNGQRSDAQSRLTEDAQLIQNILVPQLRMAGYSSVITNGGSPRNSQRFAGPGVRGCDAGFANPSIAPWDAAQNDDTGYSTRVGCNNSEGATPPAIAILYEADVLNTPPTAGNDPTDCLGQGLTAVTSSLANTIAGDTVTVAENRYYLTEDDTTKLLTLMCQGSGGANAMPLIDNIEQMRITYGVNLETGTTDASGEVLPGTENQAYMTAAQIDADETFNDDALDRWRRVSSVRLCIVLRTESPVSAGEANTITDCDGQSVSDTFLRKVIRTTVALRNRT